MIGVDLDATELIKLNKAMQRYGVILPRSVTSKALSRASKPMLQASKNYAPVGSKISYKKPRDGQKGSANDQGGATRRDMRIKSVKAEGSEAARVIVGVSKKRGKVGWRTRFITEGTKDRWTDDRDYRGRVKSNNFLKRAHDNTINIVEMNFGKELQDEVLKWGKKNLPNGWTK